MNEQLFIQWLKQLPRVGQGLSEEQNKRSDARANDTSTDKDIGTTSISLIGLSAAAKGIDVLTEKFNETAKAASGLLQPIEQFNIALGTSTKLSAQILTPSQKQQELLKGQNISQQSILQNAINFSKLLPGQAANIQKSSSEFGTLNALLTSMTEKQGVSNEAALNFGRFLAASGEDSKILLDNLQMSAKAIEFGTGETGVFRDQINAVGSLSAATRQEFRGTAEELAAAALQATRLGTSLEDSRTSSEKFLNIQGSIESELISMQMTGINQAKEMNQLRMAAQMGDYDQIAQIQSKLISENFEQVKKKGRIAMKAYAEGIGLTVEEMSKMYETSKGVNALQQENKNLTLEQFKATRGISTEEENILKRFEDKAKAARVDIETLTMGGIQQDENLAGMLADAINEEMAAGGIDTDVRTAYERAEEITSTAKEGVAARLGEDSETLISGVEAGANELATNIKDLIDATADGNDLGDLAEFTENLGKTFLSSLAKTVLGEQYIVNVAKAVEQGTNKANSTSKVAPKTTTPNNRNSIYTGTTVTE